MGSLRIRLGLANDWRHGQPVSWHDEEIHAVAKTQEIAEPRLGKSAPNPPPNRFHSKAVMECVCTRAAHSNGAASGPLSYPTPLAPGTNVELPSPDQKKHSHTAERPGMRSHHATPGRSKAWASKPTQTASSNQPSGPGRLPFPLGGQLFKSDPQLLGVSKRARPVHDVDGPSTSHLPVKKRRLQHRLVTSRLSRPYSMPATHILNRYASAASEGSPVLARVLKAAKWWGHQTAQVRKAAIMNRVRRGIRQAAGARGNDRMWRFAGVHVLGHSLQLVTGGSTGAMFPGRGGGEEPVPRSWRPHTTGAPGAFGPGPGPGSGNGHSDTPGPLSVPLEKQAGPNPHASPASLSLEPAAPQAEAAPSPPRTLIMTPLGGDGNLDEIAAFPAAELEGRYADLSDDDMDDIYANFEELLGGNGDGVRSPGSDEGAGGEKGEADVFYEEYLDGMDGIAWVS